MKTKSKFAKAMVCLLAVAALTAAFVISPTVFWDGKTASKSDVRAEGKAWMKSLDGGKRISQFSMPGTHNSGARLEPIRGTARCQNLTISQQLNAGVRFLDIRCRHVNDAFDIYHGSIYQHLNFGDVLRDVLDFLRLNPCETVVMSVKEEHVASGNSRSFEATFDAYVAENSSRWLLSSAIPTLDEARGKIVLLRRFGSGGAKGIDASNWPDNAIFSSGQLRVQDVYKVPDTAAKWSAIHSMLSQSRSDNAPQLRLNFASGVQSWPFGIPSVTRVSSDINPRLTQFFADRPRGNFGCVIVDFADAKLCAAIYRANDAPNDGADHSSLVGIASTREPRARKQIGPPEGNASGTHSPNN